MKTIIQFTNIENVENCCPGNGGSAPGMAGILKELSDSTV